MYSIVCRKIQLQAISIARDDESDRTHQGTSTHSLHIGATNSFVIRFYYFCHSSRATPIQRGTWSFCSQRKQIKSERGSWNRIFRTGQTNAAMQSKASIKNFPTDENKSASTKPAHLNFTTWTLQTHTHRIFYPLLWCEMHKANDHRNV